MRRTLLLTLASTSLWFGFAGCGDRQMTEPTDPAAQLEGRAPGGDGCLNPAQQSIEDDVRADIEELFVGRGGQRPANAHIDNIERKLCEEQYDEALEMAWAFLGLIAEKTPDQFNGSPADAAALGGDVFRLVASDPNPAEPVEIPAGVFEPTGGLVTLDPSLASPEDPLVAATRNGEAALVVTSPDVFPPGTGGVTIALSRAPSSEITSNGGYIPGFQAYEQGYDIVSSHQPSSGGPGALIALCAVPPEPIQPAIGHLHESDVSLLVPAGDPEAAGYIDCSGAAGAEGLAGRTRLLSSSAPVDPTIVVGETVQLSVGTDAAWSSDDTGVATVDANGLVTGVAAGTATITATFGSESQATTVTVVEAQDVTTLTYAVVGGSHNEVVVIETVTGTVVGTIPVGEFPSGVAFSPDGTRAYVANAALTSPPGSISVIETATSSVLTTIPGSVRHPQEIAMTPDGAFIYVVAGFDGLMVVNTETNTVAETMQVGSHPIVAAVSPDGSRLYVGDAPDLTTGTVWVVETATNTVVGEVGIGGPPGGLVVTPDGAFVYVSASERDEIAVISTSTNTVVASIPLPYPPGDIAMTPDGRLVYVAASTRAPAAAVSVIETATNTIVETVDLSSGIDGEHTGKIAISPDGALAYVKRFVSGQTSNEALVIETTGNSVIAQVPLPGGGTSGLAIADVPAFSPPPP